MRINVIYNILQHSHSMGWPIHSLWWSATRHQSWHHSLVNALLIEHSIQITFNQWIITLLALQFILVVTACFLILASSSHQLFNRVELISLVHKTAVVLQVVILSFNLFASCPPSTQLMSTCHCVLKDLHRIKLECLLHSTSRQSVVCWWLALQV